MMIGLWRTTSGRINSLQADWDVGLYCKNEDGLVENHKVGRYIIRNEVSNIRLGKMTSTQLMRKADLIDCEVIATAK